MDGKTGVSVVKFLKELYLSGINKDKLRKYNLSKNLQNMADLLEECIASLENGKVPVSEYNNLFITLNLSPKLASAFTEEYRGLGELFEKTMPNVLKLLQDADYLLFEEQNPENLKYHSDYDDKIRLACLEMARASGALRAYSREFENLSRLAPPS